MNNPRQSRNGQRVPGDPMLPDWFKEHRLSRATIETPIILAYAALIVTVITVLYWLFGG